MTDWYGIKNRPGTLKQHGKLASTINQTVTAMNVRSEDTGNFPPAPFLCTIGDEGQGYEIVKVTAVSGTEFTIERGIGDSTARAFIGTTPVRINPLAEHIQQIQDAVDEKADNSFKIVVVVEHEGDATVARPDVPTGWVVAWRGTVTPNNWVDGDLFIDTS